MELFEAITLRRSVRLYKPECPKQEIIWNLFSKARLAPSACNIQPWYFYVVTNKEIVCKIQSAYKRDWFKTAPAIIVACADYESSWKRSYDGKNYGDVDLSIIFDHITLLAYEAGLGTCWIGAFDPAILKEVFPIRKNLTTVALTPIGYPADKIVQEKKRKDVGEILEFIL